MKQLWQLRRQIAAWLLCGVTALVLSVFVWRLTDELLQVRAGTQTPAEAIEALGDWFRGRSGEES